MKLNSLLLCACFALSVNSIAQKIQIKKGVIYKDKEAVAKLEGSAKSIKESHLTISSLDDKLQMKIDETIINFKGLFHSDLHYYNFDFPGLGKSVIREIELGGSFGGSEKKLVEELYQLIGPDFLTASGLNSNTVEQFVTSRDDSEKINADTIYINNLIKKGLEALEAPVPKRKFDSNFKFVEFSQPITWTGREQWKTISPNAEMVTLSVRQDGVLLGLVVKVLEKSYNQGVASVSSSDYYVLRKVDPFEVQGNTIEYVPMAWLDCSTITSLYVVGRRMNHEYKAADIGNAETQLIRYLIEDNVF